MELPECSSVILSMAPKLTQCRPWWCRLRSSGWLVTVGRCVDSVSGGLPRSISLSIAGMVRSVASLWIVLACAVSQVGAASNDGILRPLVAELPRSLEKVPPARVVGDRFEYWADDSVGQFLAIVGRPEQAGKGSQLRIELRREDPGGAAASVATLSIPQVAVGAFSVDMTKRSGRRRMSSKAVTAAGRWPAGAQAG